MTKILVFKEKTGCFIKTRESEGKRGHHEVYEVEINSHFYPCPIEIKKDELNRRKDL